MARSVVAQLHIGGMVAGGFARDGAYFLAVSHDGRGVYDCATWRKVARDDEPSYPASGVVIGIGPIDREAIPVVERGNAARLICESSDGVWQVTYEDGMAVVTRSSR